MHLLNVFCRSHGRVRSRFENRRKDGEGGRAGEACAGSTGYFMSALYSTFKTYIFICTILQDRYASFNSGIGQKINSGTATLEECEVLVLAVNVDSRL